MRIRTVGYVLCGSLILALATIAVAYALPGDASLAGAWPLLVLASCTLLLAGAAWGSAFQD